MSDAHRRTAYGRWDRDFLGLPAVRQGQVAQGDLSHSRSSDRTNVSITVGHTTAQVSRQVVMRGLSLCEYM